MYVSSPLPEYVSRIFLSILNGNSRPCLYGFQMVRACWRVISRTSLRRRRLEILPVAALHGVQSVKVVNDAALHLSLICYDIAPYGDCTLALGTPGPRISQSSKVELTHRSQVHE